jgi:hypothetical protein
LDVDAQPGNVLATDGGDQNVVMSEGLAELEALLGAERLLVSAIPKVLQDDLSEQAVSVSERPVEMDSSDEPSDVAEDGMNAEMASL